MNKAMNYFQMLLVFLKNFPSIVLDSREMELNSQAEKIETHRFKTLMSDFEIKVRSVNKSGMKKKYRMIIFITDL